MALRLVKFSPCLRAISAVQSFQCRAMSDDKGGKGHIRAGGGKFKEMEDAREGEYFRKLQAQQLKELKDSMSKSMDFHKEQIEDYEKAIAMHKAKLKEIEKLSKKSGEDSD